MHKLQWENLVVDYIIYGVRNRDKVYNITIYGYKD